jgi:hypothetical protein
VSDRCPLLAGYVRQLSDDDLNDLLVELPPARFVALLDAALASKPTQQARPPSPTPSCRRLPAHAIP